MIRRVHLSKLLTGAVALPVAEAHHVRDVLRLEEGASLELFDDSGNSATGVITHVNSANVVVQVDAIEPPRSAGAAVTVASAVPKGDRAEWMVEKLSELGVARFIPLATERSVVLPSGRNKIERWERIAVESAKQSRRTGVMSISPLTSLANAISGTKRGVYLSTLEDASPIARAIDHPTPNEITLLIGPEGGWADGEIGKMNAAGFVAARLTSTVLRVETAAVLAAGLVLCLQTPR